MFRVIKQVSIAIPSLSRSLTTRCVSLNCELCMAIPALVDLNPIELNYYLFMVSLDKCNGNSNADMCFE